MKKTKTRQVVEKLKVIDKKAVNLSKLMRNTLVKAKGLVTGAKNTGEKKNQSPAEHASSTVENKTKSAVRETARYLPNPRTKLPVYMNRARTNFNDVKRIAVSARKHRSILIQRKALRKKMSAAPKTRATANKSFAVARTIGRRAKSAGKSAALLAKLSMAALKSLISALIAGGFLAVIIIVVISLIAMLVGSVFGIFFSGADSGTGRTMPSVVAELTTDFYEGVEQIKNDNPHDVLDMEAMSINWIDVLAVYAVKVNTDPNNAADVATMDDGNAALLRNVLNDMYSLTYSLKTETLYVISEVDGADISEPVEVTTLKISLLRKSAEDMAAYYGFTDTQKSMLSEILHPEYAMLWAALIGGYVIGSGETLIYAGSLIPNSILSWPLAVDYPITSGFGYRRHPITGETQYHGGIDISAPFGMPIIAAADGIVLTANSTDIWGGTYGFHVKIKHCEMYSTFYAHASLIAVVVGQEVKKGEIIAYIGSTGRSTGNHLHWEILRNGARVNPLFYFD